MRLKRVKLFGFKTFADKTEIDVEGDIIAVVGPNGCGKSNLVDAILWGLGEGTPRQLRAGTNQDVIFSGSSKRKPVGYAEVTLLFDNEDGALPIEASEVSITRRLTRNGDSDYSINRQSCRLRDIFDLLADSGLGRAGYAIVGQKEIDQALAASPEDRRGWVDEAAGVQRYRARKVESLRRLQSARTHLDRVRDILHEIEAQREPLREEAEVARRYKTAQTSLREVESGLLIVEVARALREVERLEVAVQESMELVGKESSRAENLERDMRRVAEAVSELERQMDGIRGEQQSALTAIQRAEAGLKLGEQRLENLSELEKNLGEESEASRTRIEEVRQEAEAFRAEEEIERANLERVRAECSGAGDDASALREQLARAEKELASGREVESRRLKAEAERAHRKGREKEIVRELAGIDAGLPDLQRGVDEALAALQEIESALADSRGKAAQLEEALQAAREEDDRHAQESRRWLAEKAALEGRARGIEATIETHEGLNQGARAVMEAAENGKLEGKFVPVAEAIEVDKELAVAIETALGAASNDLIVPDEDSAKRAIAYLKDQRRGRATFQPIPLMRPMEPSSELRRVLTEKGVVGRASELVTCISAHRPVVDSLLGRVLVVETLDLALKLARTHGWSRLVTLEGEVVHGSGAVTGGHSGKTSYGLVQRKSDLVEVRRAIADLERKLAKSEKEVAAARERRETDEQALRALRAEIAEAADEHQERRNWHANLQQELEGAMRAHKKLELEREQLSQQAEEALADPEVAALESRRDALLKQLAARSADAEQAEERLREAEERLRQAALRLQQAERRLIAAEEADSMRARKLDNLEPERSKARQEIERERAELTQAQERKAKADAELAAAQEKKAGMLQQSFQFAEDAKAARQNAQSCGDAAHQAELGRARADAKRAASLQRLVEEYGLTEEDALEQEHAVELPADAATVVGRLRRELRAMGDVNVGAIEAFERLSERCDELTAQKADIEEGIEQVEGSVRELDALTRDKFLATMDALEVAFTEVFEKLFGGGVGKISLSTPNNVLESGIEIEVQLPGKKQQRLELLSGGERSLCATAFLFALLKVKPSPLVVLDEVDAPLDGRNVERFVALLRDFSATSQFVVITHNPTTIEAAPVWLGITMQEPGVSTLVPAKLPKAAVEDRELAPSKN
ncbi:MAG: chromosome segregation protein SMC [Fimbriimonadaceae bacterium]|nr:chromosome segregation protein SMC [Fimbriimonadaceae bacterium]